jgi:hypothetical protein
MKRKKYSKQTKKIKKNAFRKSTTKRYKKNRIGGIDWAVPVPKSPGKTPKQPTPKSPTESLKQLLSRVDKDELRPLALQNLAVQSYKSKKSPGKKQSPLNISGFDQDSDIKSISHVQETYVPMEPIIPPPPATTGLKIDERITSYKLSSKDKDSQSSSGNAGLYEPGKPTYLETPPNEIQVPQPDGTTINIPMYGFIPAPLPPSPPQGLTVKYGSLKTMSGQDYKTLLLLNEYSRMYFYLSPKLYKIMNELQIHELFGVALVWGDLNDQLIECIGESSEKAIESRLLYTDKPTIHKFIEKCKNFYMELGDSVNNRTHNKPYNYDAASPFKHTPSNYQVMGYNQHQFFNPVPITQVMYEHGMRNNKKKTNEYVFIQAHGGLGTELSQHKKILAKKYIRLIEFGSRFQMVAANIRTLYKHINDLMRSKDYPILFENTTKGKEMRKIVYSDLCKYFMISSESACTEKDSLTLVDITHDRIFQGHFSDLETPENQKITFRSIEKFKSMGMFLANDYTTDITDKFLYNKEMFKLYPGSTFLTTTTKMKLVDTLLPIAINENKIFNVIVFSCAVRYEDEQPYIRPPPMPRILGVPVPPPNTLANKEKPRNEMFLIHLCKSYISQLLRFITDFEIAINPVMNFFTVTDIYQDNKVISKVDPLNIHPNNEESLFSFITEIGNLYDKKLRFFNSYTPDALNGTFSFNMLGEHDKPYYLIDPVLNPNINDKLNDELITIKLYIIKEFYDYCYKKTLFCMRVANFLYSLLYHNHQRTSDPRHKQGYDQNIFKLQYINSYFLNVQNMLNFCNRGLQKTGVDSFYNYPKFVEIANEYKKKHMNKLYDKLFPNMEFDSYELEVKKMPTGWIATMDSNTNRTYYVNTITGRSFWSKPLIPPGWSEHIDSNTGQPYYIHNQTNARSDTLPGEGYAYDDSMYFSNTRKLKNANYDEHKQRNYAYKYDEMENIDKVRKRRDMTRRKMAIKPHLLSAARNMTRSMHRREGERLGLQAQAQTEQWKKNVYLMKQAEENIKPNIERYHVST